MRFEEINLPDAFLVHLERFEDERGSFARIWCQEELDEHGLNPVLAQSSISFNRRAGTLRGMHYQAAPHREAKLVRCTRGGIYDVIIDLRPESSTYKHWFGAELTDSNDRMLYVPEDFAHGFITLAESTEVTYFISEFYHPESQRGLRYDDPAIGIRWPRGVDVISERDLSWPTLQSAT